MFREYRSSDWGSAVKLQKVVLEALGRNGEDLVIPDRFFVLEHGGELIAMGGYRIADEGVELRSMRVHPSFQSEGIGSKLLQVLETEIMSRGHKRIFFDTVNAERFYLRHGYTTIGHYTYAGMTCIEMEKWL
jgi:N-acetylglutamate synthase-like GNAT family acetyltransferase